MKRLAQLISWLALAGTLFPAPLFFADKISLPAAKACLLAATAAWFLATPFWLERKPGA